MSQSVQKQLSPYKNENLFSRHYLKKVIERRDLWEVDEQELENKLDKLKEIHEDESYYLPNRTNDEVELRNNYITKILREVLGFNKEQEKPGQASSRVPDYALYADESQKKEASDTGQYYENAVALVEAKAWKKDLEKRNASGSPAMENNPMKQVVDYLIDNKPQWGMLTNGKRWRLVNREATNRLDTYYEINIVEEIIEEDDREKALEKFKYFYVFFRKEALEGKEGDKILDEILEESIQYAKDIGEDLEENIYQALEWISKGYLNNSRNDGIEDEPIEKIHDNALILLYRLLFTHYADARDILGNPSGPYDRYNFSDFVDEVCEEIDEGEGYGKGGLLGSQLWEIFSLIDKGSEAKGIPKDEFHIPAYNGGLFAEEKHEFFQKYNIHDEYLAKVIDLVARTKKGDQKGKARVDYYDLSVRHLGGIYEGLLEYQLEKADEDMVEVKEDGDKVVKTVEEAEEDGDSFSDDDIIEEGQPYLVTDDGERKATGSYYTPDYIVKYIVENTVGPKVEEEIEDLESDEEKAEAILDMQILDPAMGSAHFLVEVIDYFATELVDYKEIEIDQAKREVARQCVYGVDVNPLATELGKLSIWLKTISEDKPLSFLDHHIKTGNSLIGADIHDINQHPEEDEDSERQVTIGEEFGEENAGVVRANVQEMLKKFKEIQEKQADSPEDIKEQEELYQEFLDFPFRKRFDVLADVYTSHYFDNNYKIDDYNRLLQAFKLQEQKEEGDEEWNQVIKEDWVQKATDSLDKSHKEDNISSKKGFFHWKLEFPEVFFDIEEGTEKQDSGFDAVVGNPPYVGEKDMKDTFRDLKSASIVNECYEGRMDMLYFFVLLGTKLIEDKGYSSMITTSYWPEADSASELRKELTKNSYLTELVHFDGYKVFKQAKGQENMITTFRKTRSSVEISYLKKADYEEDEVRKSLLGDKEKFWNNKVDYEDLDLPEDGSEWMGFKPLAQGAVEIEGEETVGDFFKSKQGAVPNPDRVTGRNIDAFSDDVSKGEGIFLLKEEDLERIGISPRHELLEKAYRNSNIHKYAIDYPENLYLLYVTSETDIDSYPKVKQHLKRYKPKLESRREVENDKIEWYSLHWPREREIFENPKIVYSNWGNDWQPYSIEDESYYERRDITVLIPQEDPDLQFHTAILNSKISKYWQEVVSSRTGYTTQSGTEGIPIPDKREEKLDKLVNSLRQSRQNFFDEKNKFLDWVSGEWGVKIDDLSLKTNLREYWEYDFDEFMRIAKKNKSQIGGNVKSREFRELMKDEWENSMLTLEPLMNKIDDLENEIDAIVFDLYNLTEEEVETVLDSLDTPEGEKASIMEEFRSLS